MYEQYGWRIDGEWLWDDVWMLYQAAELIRVYYSEHGGGDARARMRGTFGEVTFKHSPWYWPFKHSSHTAGHTVYQVAGHAEDVMIHEIGHVLDNAIGGDESVWSGGGPADDMAQYLGGYPAACGLRFWCDPFLGGSWVYDPAPSREPLQPRAYGRKGPAEDFADVFMFGVVGKHGAEYPLRLQWMAHGITSLTVAAAPFAGGPYPSKGHTSDIMWTPQ